MGDYSIDMDYEYTAVSNSRTRYSGEKRPYRPKPPSPQKPKVLTFEQKRQNHRRGSLSTSKSPTKPQIFTFTALRKFNVYRNMNLYDLGSQVGEGTYGQVFKAKNKVTGKFVALKKLYLKEDDKGKEKNRDGFPITALREIEILRSLYHPNIVQLQAMISMSTGVDNLDMYMVFEYMDHDLTGVLNNSVVVYRQEHIKCLSKQLFQGLAYLHDNKIIHRDVKGANLLLNNEGYLKIADFGLARRIQLDRDSDVPLEGYQYTNRVVTLWYRSPELLLGSTNYTYAVDVWSTGCIILEFYTKYAIFQGRAELEQLELIFKLCGSPTPENFPEISTLPWYEFVNFPPCDRILVKEFSNESYGLSQQFVLLLDALLALSPASRPTAKQALSHPYFTSELPLPCEPRELPKIEGDWHEYEGKQRKKVKNNAPNAPSSVSTANFAETSNTMSQQKVLGESRLSQSITAQDVQLYPDSPEVSQKSNKPPSIQKTNSGEGRRYERSRPASPAYPRRNLSPTYAKQREQSPKYAKRSISPRREHYSRSREHSPAYNRDRHNYSPDYNRKRRKYTTDNSDRKKSPYSPKTRHRSASFSPKTDSPYISSPHRNKYYKD
ncbi:kinase subunit of RNA polymerase II carboxy-terminal domain kinase I [Boothiomyces sp. JEL0866]|nr:kinase subunit of RNA polymerase II carboxy-terminal domain kinase I [Boothiomyces sp. JEL0866]